jgi:hypothetical protein
VMVISCVMGVFWRNLQIPDIRTQRTQRLRRGRKRTAKKNVDGQYCGHAAPVISEQQLPAPLFCLCSLL